MAQGCQLSPICCRISIVLHYFTIIINFEWFWKLSVLWYCKKLMKSILQVDVSCGLKTNSK